MENRMSLLTSPFVPEGMVDLMKKLSKGVIKERPANIYEYAAEFFEKMLIERDGSLDKGYGKFRSYTEYCKFMDKMDQRRLNQTNKNIKETTDAIDTNDEQQEEVISPSTIEVQGVAIHGVERKSKDNVKNVSINPKYKSQNEKVLKPAVTSNANNVKKKPRKLSSKKPSENLIVIKEETSADVDDSGNGESKLNKAAVTIQKAFRMYMSKTKTNQDDHLSADSGNVSQLSEDAAAIIIQKAFKSLIQKLKPSPRNDEKIDVESNNNIVMPSADGQENEVNVAKIINNIDENSEQILNDDEERKTKKLELQHEDKPQATSKDTTTTAEEIEMNEIEASTNLMAVMAADAEEAMNLEAITASDTVEEQQIESNDQQIAELNSNDSESDTFHQVDTASDNNNEISDDVASTQENEALNILENVTRIPEISTEVNEIKETVLNKMASDEAAPNQNEIANDKAVENSSNDAIEKETELGEGSFQNLESNENQVESISNNSTVEPLTSQAANEMSNLEENVSNDPTSADTSFYQDKAEAVEDQLSTKTAYQLGSDSNTTDHKENEKIGNDPEHTESATLLNVMEAESSTNVVEEIVLPKKQDDENQLERTDSHEMKKNATLVEHGENIALTPPSEVDTSNTLNDNVEEDLSTENNSINHMGEKTEELPVNEEQLFVVDKDGIYVNMDILQEKLGTVAVDDGLGSDSEKSFKLNILEGEEILVNQENVQQIKEEPRLATNEHVDRLDQSSNNDNAKTKEEIARGTERMENNFDVKDEEGNEEYELAETVVLVDVPLKSKSIEKIGPSIPVIANDKLSTNTLKPNKYHELGKLESNVVEKLSESASILENLEKDDVKGEKIITQEIQKQEADIAEGPNVENTEAKNISIKDNVEEETNEGDQLNKTAIVHAESDVEVGLTEENVKEEIANESVDDQLNKKEMEAVSESEEAVKENVTNQLFKNEKEQTISSLEATNGIDEVDFKNELDDEKLNLEGVDDDIQAKTELIASKENHLQIQIEGESEVNQKNVDVGQETKIVIQENVANEKMDLRDPDVEFVNTEDNEKDSMLKNKENEELVKAATIIQKVFRGYIVRNSVNNKNQLDQLSAALIIQKYVRGYLVRRNIEKNTKLSVVQVTSNQIEADGNEAIGSEENSNNEVVPSLPAYSNRFLIPKDSFLERESFADDEDYARTCKELAATSIQKTYRGYRVRRSLKASSENDTESNDAPNGFENGIESFDNNDQVKTVVTEAERVISAVLDVAADVLPTETYDSDSFEDEGNEDKSDLNEHLVEPESVLGQIVQDNIHVEDQMHQKFNQMKFQGSPINPIEEMSDSSEQPETPRIESSQNAFKAATLESDSIDSKHEEVLKSFSYEQLSSDLSDTDENKRESLKESEVDETSRDERDDLSEVENFDLSSCGEDSLEAMYYSIRKSEIILDKMHKQVADQRESRSIENGSGVSENMKIEFPERVTENLDVAMQQVFKSMESSSDCDAGKKDEDDNSCSSTLGLDLGLDDSSSINDEKEIETSRQIIQSEETNLEENVESGSTSDSHTKYDEEVVPRLNIDKDAEASNTDQSQQSDSSFNSSTRFIMKSQSVSEDMMNPIMFAMKRKQALLDQMHVRYPLQENLSEDHDAFPEHLLTDIDIGNIQRKIFASSISETDSDYIEPNATSRRLVRDDFNISTALDHLSTDSDSTIVSAATKIQAGARGFLTRRRLRRSSAGGTSISFEKRCSFGNAAIDKSLEDLIKRQEQINLDGAALKIQQQYRRYQARKNDLKKVSPIREQQTLELSGGSSIDGVEGIDDNIGIREITLAQKKVDDVLENVEETMETHPISLNIDTVDTVEPVKRTPVNQRRLTLQRGDAVQRNSRPDSQEINVKDANYTNTDNQSNGKFKDSETGEYTGAINTKQEKKVTAYINIQSLINRGIGPRQRSMPVQIDSELMRIIPKHLRKRVKSADIAKKKSH